MSSSGLRPVGLVSPERRALNIVEELPMTGSVVSTTHPTRGLATWLCRGVLTAYLFALAAVCGLAFVYGPQIHAAHEAQKGQAIDEENQAFCSRFGVGPGTTRFAECVTALRDVRVRHDERSAPLFF
jgi:hypothetical protein